MFSTNTTLSKDNFNQMLPTEKLFYLMASLQLNVKLPKLSDTPPEVNSTVEFDPKLLTCHPMPHGFHGFSITSSNIEETLKDMRVKAEKREMYEARERMKKEARKLEIAAKCVLTTGYDIDPKNCGAKPCDMQHAWKATTKATSNAIKRGFLPPLEDGIAEPVAGTSDLATLSSLQLYKYLNKVLEYDVARLIRPSLTEDRKYFSFMGIFRCCNNLVLQHVKAEEKEMKHANSAAYELQQAQYMCQNMCEVYPVDHQQVLYDQSHQGPAPWAYEPGFVSSSKPSTEQSTVQKYVDQPASMPTTPSVSPPIEGSKPVIVNGSSRLVIINGSSLPCNLVVEPDKVDALPPEEETKPELEPKPESEPEPEPEPKSGSESPVSSSATSSDEPSGHNTDSVSEEHHTETNDTSPSSSFASLTISTIKITFAPLPRFDEGCPVYENWADEIEDSGSE